MRVALICALTVACSADNSARAHREVPSRSDSAGIEIVQNGIRDSLSQSVWTVDSRPAVDIGAREGAPEYLLAKVAGAMRVPDGRILVAESDARLRYFDSTGKHDTTISRSGQGPGEVGQIARMVPYIGDSLLIVGVASGTSGRDGGIQIAKLVVLDSRGRYGSQSELKLTFPIAKTITLLTALGIEGVVPNGDLLLRRAGVHPTKGSRGIRWRPDFYVTASRDGERVDTVVVRQSVDLDETPEKLPLHEFTLPLFARHTIPVAISGRQMYWGNGDNFEIQVFDLLRDLTDTLRPVRIVRYDRPNHQVDNAVTERYLALMLGADNTVADSNTRRAEHKSTPWRPTLPAFQSLIVDADGNLWVEHYRVSSYARLTSFLAISEDGAERNVWTVFDSTGSTIGEVVTPMGLRVTQIGRDWILGIWADEDDVQHVRLHRITK